VLTLTPESVKEENCKSKPSRKTTFSKPDNFRYSTSTTTSNTSLERGDLDLSNKIYSRYIEDYQSKPSRDTTCLKPDNLCFNACIETYNISLKRRDSYLSSAISLASIAWFVVELQQIKQGTSNIANWSQAVIRLVWNPVTSVVIRVLQYTVYPMQREILIFWTR
jgi:hypothetical protein